jgi:DNA ligase-1
MTFKPLLASPVDFDKLDYGNTWLSCKLDGIRAIVIDGVVMSRKLKPIPNAHVQRLFGGLEHLDGELIVGEPNAKDVYQKTCSGVMSADGEPDVRFFAFDHIEDPTAEYCRRFVRLSEYASDLVKVVTQHGLLDHASLLDLETFYLEQGYEGVMLRAFQGPRSFYKFGRSTPKETTLLKLKRFEDAEAVVVGFEEEMRNDNEATTDALGRTKRSSHAENKVGKGRLGALVCQAPEGIEFNIGTGFTAAQREHLWIERSTWLGRIAKYKSFAIGVKDAPRFPVFLGWRDPIDM